MESVLDNLRIPVFSSLANNSFTSTCPRWLSGYEWGRAPGEEHRHSRWQEVSIRNWLHFYRYISQHNFPVASHFFHFLFQIIYQLSVLSSVWLIFSLATGNLHNKISPSFIMYSDVLSKLVAHTQLSAGRWLLKCSIVLDSHLHISPQSIYFIT